MLLIDTYNVIHLPEAPPELVDGGAFALCRMLSRSRYAGREIALICDGTAPTGAARTTARGEDGGGFEVAFVGPHRSADDEIEARLRERGGPRVLVVSTDRRLRRAAKRARARSVTSGTFLGHLLADLTRKRAGLPAFASEVPLDPYSVAAWMEEFGMASEGVLERLGGAGRRAADPRSARDPRPADRGGAPPSPAQRESPFEPSEVDIGRVLEDPLLREAVREWGDRLPPGELDMRRWLEERGRGQR